MYTISVVVPCFNQGEYLYDSIGSLLVQNITSWECIIVDDGSTDNTNKIASEFVQKDDRIKYVYKKNGGLSLARNTGINLASAEFILPLDADDKIAPNYLSSALLIFSEQPDVKLVYGNAYRFGDENCFWDLGKYSYEKLLLENQIFCSAIFKKEDWIECGGYDESIRVGWEDWEFWINMLSKEDIVYKIDEIVFYYRIRKNSMLRETSHEKYLNVLRYIFHKHWDKYIDIFKDPLTAYSKVRQLENQQRKISVSFSKKYFLKFKNYLTLKTF